MFGLIMLAKMFTRTVEASFHRGNTRREDIGNLGMASAFLDQRKQRAVLGPQLGQGVAQGVELLGSDRAPRFGNVFVLFAEWQKNPPQFLPPQLIDARIPREPEQPGFKLGGCLQMLQGADHLDKDLLGEILHIIASPGHSVNETSHSMLVADNEIPLGALVAFLGPPHKVFQCVR